MDRRNVLALLGWMLGTLLAFSAIAVGVRAASKGLAVFEILALRNLFAILVLLAIALPRAETRAALRPRRMPLHLLRNVMHFGATYGWALALTLLPLATVFALEFTTPFWVALLAIPLLGERMTLARAAALLLGFAGVLIILRPGIETLQLGAFIVLAAAIGFAAVTIATKRLTTTEGTLSIVFWMNMIQLPLNLIGSGRAFWHLIGQELLGPLAAVCIGGLMAHWCLTNAYRCGDASVVVPLDFLRIPLIALVGWQVYGEPLDPLLLVGSVVIVVGILINLRAEAARA